MKEKGRGGQEMRIAEAAEWCLHGRQPLLASSHPTSPSLSSFSLSRAVCRLSRSQVSMKRGLRLTALQELLWRARWRCTHARTHTRTCRLGFTCRAIQEAQTFMPVDSLVVMFYSLRHTYLQIINKHWEEEEGRRRKKEVVHHAVGVLLARWPKDSKNAHFPKCWTLPLIC